MLFFRDRSSPYLLRAYGSIWLLARVALRHKPGPACVFRDQATRPQFAAVRGGAIAFDQRASPQLARAYRRDMGPVGLEIRAGSRPEQIASDRAAKCHVEPLGLAWPFGANV